MKKGLSSIQMVHWPIRLNDDVILHNHNFGEIWIMNIRTGKKTLTDVEWVSAPIDEKDSLYVYSDGHKRGYFMRIQVRLSFLQNMATPGCSRMALPA